jgi:hypothetical protein
MAMIFPGMDPYLEHPQRWPTIHSRLIVYIADTLQPSLRPHYIASIQERVYVEGPDREVIPDVSLKRTWSGPEASVALANGGAPVIVRVPEVEIHETYVAILDRETGRNVVTIIEAVSPANKFPGPGRKSYLEKQRQVLHSQTHLVEIDLLRAGPHTLAIPEWVVGARANYDYLCCVNRARGPRDEYEFYPILLTEPLPRINIPLADADPDVPLNLQAILSQVYEAGSYFDLFDYDAPCLPPLAADQQTWAQSQIQRAKQRLRP